MGQY